MTEIGNIRQNEREKIVRFAREGARVGGGLLVAAPPLAGVSDLLAKVHDQLFEANETIFPVRFSFQTNESAEAAAQRFLRAFLLQAVAFRRRDRRILNAAPELAELAALAAPADGYWIDRLLAAIEEAEKRGDRQSLVRQAFGAPLRAAAQKGHSILILDDFHHADESLIKEIKQIFRHSIVPFIIGGQRRALAEKLQTGENALPNVETIVLPPLTFTEACALAEKLSRQFVIEINEQTRDLITLQLEGNGTFIANLIQHAAERQKSLSSFEQCQQVYAHELLHGRIYRYFSAIFEQAARESSKRRELVALLHNALASEDTKSALESWRKRLNFGAEEDFEKTMRELHRAEILRLDASLVEVGETSLVARDYIAARHRLEIEAQPRALVFAETLAAALKRAPELMARYYRRTAALGLRALLAVFNLQEIPSVLFDYARFRQNYKGADDAETKANLDAETEKLQLPQIVYVANCAEFYPPFERLTDIERAAVALGFESGNYRDENQIVWIAAEIESKLEASAQTVEFWLDRLEAVAVFCDFARVQFWLVAPEGFADEAAAVLRERSASGSSRKQIELLAARLAAEKVFADKQKSSQNEFELVVPMGDDTEIIAAQAVEEIARRFNFKPTAINQIKTALVEACINAAEHSLSPERKIYQKFRLDNDRLIITVSNRGLQIPPEKLNGSQPEEKPTGRRGFGLRLIKSLMDEVEFVRTDDGTQIRMTKLK